MGSYEKHHPSWIAALIVLMVPAAFQLANALAWQFVCVFFIFPALVASAACYEPKASLARLFNILGLSSYAVYVLHKPVYQVVLGALIKILPYRPEELAPWTGIAYLPFICAIALLVDKFYDVPLRRWLTQTVGKQG